MLLSNLETLHPLVEMHNQCDAYLCAVFFPVTRQGAVKFFVILVTALKNSVDIYTELCY